MKIFNNSSIESCLLKILIISCLLIAGYLFSTYSNVPVNRDAGYYIPISKAVMNGATPTVEIHTAYTPFLYYVYAAWMKLFGTNYSTIILLVYIVNALNTIILYSILSYYTNKTALKLILCLSYYYTAMIIGAYNVILEPFQVLFFLLAYLVYVKYSDNILKYSLIGILVGISIMFKQYSILILIGFLIALWIDSKKSCNNTTTLIRALIVVLCSFTPFLVFVAFTKADFIGSLQSFGFLGKSAISYAASEQPELTYAISNMLRKVLHLNWLFVPLFLYVYFLFSSKDKANFSKGIIPICLLSAIPMTVRQFGHYYQLIAPWSYLMWGILLDNAINRLQSSKIGHKYLVLGSAICLFLVVPLFVAYTPGFHAISKFQMAGIAFVFNVIVFGILSLCSIMSRLQVNRFLITLVIALVLGFQTLFIGLKIPFPNMKSLKEFQITEARLINSVFPMGSSVYVLDYPQLYVTCDFVDPLNEYAFFKPHNLSQKMASTDWTNIEKIMLIKNNPLVPFTMLEGLGYTMKELPTSIQVALFERELAAQPIHGTKYDNRQSKDY